MVGHHTQAAARTAQAHSRMLSLRHTWRAWRRFMVMAAAEYAWKEQLADSHGRVALLRRRLWEWRAWIVEQQLAQRREDRAYVHWACRVATHALASFKV